ncbi:hypothetical protein [uncultured Roseibium sp.]|uniref:hypothetical protein n=1 Tax=uncultured Roseibium sp. TaxID=1936171 RepID=UPI00259A5F7B|nr:hypothetical protein [uncultured Roseibium sp.]
MPLSKAIALVLCLFSLSGCAAVAVGGAVFGATGTVVGTAVSATTTVAGTAVDVVVPDGDDD